MSSFTAKQIAQAIGKAPRTIQIKAQKESWPFELKAGKGGQIPHYALNNLPNEIAHQVASAYQVNYQPQTIKGEQAAVIGQGLVNTQQLNKQITKEIQQEGLKEFAGLTESEQQRANHSLTLLNAALAFAKQSTEVKHQALETFATQYNARLVAIDSGVYQSFTKVSRTTLTRWEGAYKKQGIMGLVAKYGNRKGSGTINSTPDMKDYCLALLHKYPHIKGERLHELLTMQFSEQYSIPSASTCRAWLKNWKEENKGLFESLFNPSGWQNNYMAAFGDMAAEVTRINQLWEFDSTPADVLLTDGRYSIVGVIDVFTRRAKMILKPTSNAQAIALLMREAVLDWGLPEVARTDNGADYQSAHILSVWDALDIENDVTNPYSGWEKPFIERFFRTFAHGLAELVDGYCGHNVADREKINARKTFAERLLEKREKGKDKACIEVALTSEQFQAFMDQWVNAVYERNLHSTLGCTPFEKFTQHRQVIKRLDDERILDVLLAPVPGNKGFRTITKEGIKVERSHFIHAELGGYVGERVFCRYNPQDVGKIFVFHALHKHFICEAVDPEIAGQAITMEHAGEAKRIQRAALREERKAVKAAAKKFDLSNEAQKYLDYRQGQTGNVEAMPKPSEQLSNEAIDSASQAINRPEHPRYTEQQLSEFEQRRAALLAEEQMPSTPIFTNDHQKARWLSQRAQEGGVSPQEKSWLHNYRRTNPAQAKMLDELLQTSKQK